MLRRSSFIGVDSQGRCIDSITLRLMELKALVASTSRRASVSSSAKICAWRVLQPHIELVARHIVVRRQRSV